MADQNALTLPAPVVVNPLAAINAGNQAATNLYNLREKQAEQAAGQAFLDSIDPATGQPNQAKLLQNLRANPATAMAAQLSAQRGVTLDTDTYNLHSKRLDAVMSGAGQLIADNPNGIPADALRKYIEQKLALGQLTPQEAQAIIPQISANPRANSQLVLQGIGHGLQAKTALDAAKPATETQDVGGRIVTIKRDPQLGTSVQPSLTVGPGVTTGPQPGTMVEGGQWVADGKGGRVWQPGRVPASSVTPPAGQPVPAPGGSGAPSPPPAGAPPLPTGYAPRGAAPASPAPAAPAPAPAPSTSAPGGSVGGKGAALSGGVPVASADGTAPDLGTAAPPSPAVAGDVAAIMAGMDNARATAPGGVRTAQNYPPAGTPLGSMVVQTPQGPFIPSGPPMGTKETLDNDIKISNDASTASADQRSRIIAGESALEALRMARTGPGTATESRWLAFMQANGITAPPQGTMSATEYRQILQKQLLRFAQTSGRTVGTDLGLETQLHSNANVDDMLAGANEHVLLQDLGIARQRYVQNLTMPQGDAGGSAAKHARTYTNETDPRGFAWDWYSQPQRDAIEAQVKKQGPAAVARLHKALEDADKYHLFTAPSPEPAAPAPVPVVPRRPAAQLPVNPLLA